MKYLGARGGHGPVSLPPPRVQAKAEDFDTAIPSRFTLDMAKVSYSVNHASVHMTAMVPAVDHDERHAR